MVARCLVSECGWNHEAAGAVELEVAVEQHRRESHEWVAVGKLHRLELEPPPEPVAVEPVPVLGPRVKVALRAGMGSVADWL